MSYSILPVEMEVQPNFNLIPSLPDSSYDYGLADFPDHFLQSPMDFFLNENLQNPITNAGATLGRVLFYDKRLSVDFSTSCASCHQQEFAFSDPARFSKGANGNLGSRNSMSLVNMVFEARFFWDARTFGLENQVIEPIEALEEMALPLDSALVRIENEDFYPPLFYNAFGDSTVTVVGIQRALAQFVRSITSHSSKYDEGVATNFENFTQLELDGRALFLNGETSCNHCHSTHTFAVGNNSSNGLSLNYEDKGIGAITGNAEDFGVFKPPTLRNIALTAPYMHDGRFATLAEVVDHYSNGVLPHQNLGDQLTVEMAIGGTPKVHNFTDYEKAALIAYMETLTDFDLLHDEKLSNPFK